MTEVQHAPADRYGDQLELEIETGTANVAVPVDITEDIVRSPAYKELVELRDAAYGNHRSGARAIARLAFVARQNHQLTDEEFDALFERPEVPRQPSFEDYATERPAREPDWAERAAGETVRHPWD